MKHVNLFSGIISIIIGVVFSSILFSMKSDKCYILIPFILGGFTFIINGIALIIKDRSLNFKNSNIDPIKNALIATKLSNISFKIYIYSFLTLWFGFLIVFDFLAIKKLNKQNLILLIFSLLFWAIGFWILKKIKRLH